MKTETILNDIYDAWRAQDIEWLGTYLPTDFCHMVHVPTEIHPLGGLRRGKTAALQRWATVAQEFDLLRFETSDLMLQHNRAGLEIPSHYRHKATGLQIETTIVNFWTFEDGWPVKLTEYYDIERVQAFTAKLAALTPLSRA
ncbi:MAG: nuclear transport factor 2 family protein [Methyloceanibacter sp.]|uniref:nuclear transport factor 2 family protein n=1 Tax=Methyloceanibacter sp. TaxID=1965321 RepID=UPI003D6D7235